MGQLLHIGDPARPAQPGGFALWQLGFRPFYLLAGGFAALSIPLWALEFAGWITRPYLRGSIWHAHEMLFGFTLAVVTGFLFTAGHNWTQRPTPTGRLLALLALLWVAGRVLVLTPFGWAAAAVNTAFPLAVAVCLAIPFAAAGNRRNYFFVGLLALLAMASLAVHLDQLGVARLPGWLGVQIGLDLVLFIMAVMAGRVIPMFTNNGVPGARATRDPWLERSALAGVLALLLADAAQLHGAWMALLCWLAAFAHLARWSLWQPWKTRHAPLVWVLHLAYFWIPVHLALRASAAVGWVSPSLAIHALTVGAAGGLIIGMMTRTARGHTGRPLKADPWDTACYAMVAGAAVVRVVLPYLEPQWTVQAILGSAGLWSAGFGLFTVRYWPVLTRSRVDGAAG